MEEFWNNLAANLDAFLPVGVVVVVPIVTVAIVLIAVTVQNVTSTRARELSRRRIAAYVAAGKLTLDDAERLMAEPKAELKKMAKGRARSDRCC